MEEHKASVAFTDGDRRALQACVNAIVEDDRDRFSTAFSMLSRCPVDPRTGDLVFEPYMLATWWLSVTCSTALELCFDSAWASVEGVAELSDAVSAWAPHWACSRKDLETLLTSLLAGVSGRVAHEVAGEGPAHLAAAAATLLAWLVAVHEIDLPKLLV